MISDSRLANYDKRELRRMLHASINIRAMGGLWMLASVFALPLGIGLLGGDEDDVRMGVILVVLSILLVIGGICSYRRNETAKTLFGIVSIVSLLFVPIGTILGALVVFLVFKYPEMWGENRILHRDIAQAYRDRKQL